MSVSDFEIICKLGEGAYSSVYKVRRVIDHSIYALKKVKLINLSTRQIHNAVNEVRILASIRHPNIIGYKEAFYDGPTKSLCIVMEYADGGDLLQKIFEYKRKVQVFDEHYIWNVFIQVLIGLAKLHQMKILHRDIKSANVFLTKSGTAKLGDMNVSKVVRKDAMCETQTGTPYYASPEVWRDEPYDDKSDVWSLGCVLYQFICLKPPFRARDMEGLYRKVNRGFYSRISKNYSDDLSSVLRAIIRVKPKERLGSAELLQLPIIKKRIKKILQPDLQEESFLLKTIKLSKNINYLTESLPKPNYSPLRYKSMTNNLSSDNLNAKFTLPPVHRRSSLPKSERGIKKKYSYKRINNNQSLPKIIVQQKQKKYIY